MVSIVGFLLALFVLPSIFIVLLAALSRSASTGSLVLVFSFLPGLLAIFMLVRLALGRPAWSVALPSYPPGWRPLVAGLLIGLIVGLVPPPYLDFEYRGFGGLIAAGASFILLTLIGLLIQTAMEEVLFRGLLLQAAYRLTGYVWIAITAQAVIFAILHIGNLQAWHGNPLGLIPYLITALAWGWLAWRTGSLLIPWMLHFANNASNALLVGTKGDVLHSVGPFAIDPPTIAVGALATLMQAVLSIFLVELYLWHARRDLKNGSTV
jgi:hypothetical protein